MMSRHGKSTALPGVARPQIYRHGSTSITFPALACQPHHRDKPDRAFEQPLHSAAKDDAARRPVVLDVAAEGCDSQERFLDSWLLREWAAAGRSKDEEHGGRQYGRCRGLRVRATLVAEGHDSPGYDEEDREKSLEPCVALDLPFLDLAAALERPEELLDVPASLVRVDDSLHVPFCLNGLRGGQ